jgi:hypothetical protein
MELKQFTEGMDKNTYAFVQDLHNYLQDNGCKATFEEKKTSLLGSYKHTKTKRSIINLLRKERGLFVRIYGENISGYSGFLNTLPEEMFLEIKNAHICGRLAYNKCSPRCSGYDFTIANEHFQKCRYGCFEFLLTEKSAAHIKAFVENETKARAA